MSVVERLKPSEEFEDGVLFGYHRAQLDFAAGKLPFPPQPAAKRSRWGLAGIRIFAAACALASLIFMGLTFYTEFFLRKGMLFIEPNLAIAGGEFVTIVLGFVAVLYLFLKDAR